MERSAIKKSLDELNIEYNKRAKTKDLLNLLKSKSKAEVPEKSDSPTSIEKPTNTHNAPPLQVVSEEKKDESVEKITSTGIPTPSIDPTSDMSDEEVLKLATKKGIKFKEGQKSEIVREMLKARMGAEKAIETGEVKIPKEILQKTQVIANLKQLGYPIDVSRSLEDLKNDLINCLLHLHSEMNKELNGVTTKEASQKAQDGVDVNDVKGVLALAHTTIYAYSMKLRNQRKANRRYAEMANVLRRYLKKVEK